MSPFKLNQSGILPKHFGKSTKNLQRKTSRFAKNDDSFKEEKEWRIVSSNLGVVPEIQFRANESNVIPYIEMALCQAECEIEFKKIFIGPSSNNQYSKEAVLQLLRKNRISQNAIRLSRAPYRCL